MTRMGHEQWIQLDKCIFKKEIGRNRFINKVVDEWNRLGSQRVRTNMLKSFKRRLDKGKFSVMAIL